MLIYVNITDWQTDGQTHQKYSLEPHKKNTKNARGIKKKIFFVFSTINLGGSVPTGYLEPDILTYFFYKRMNLLLK